MEATACFKNLIPKAIRDAFSVMLVTQTTLGPQWEGTTQGHNMHLINPKGNQS